MLYVKNLKVYFLVTMLIHMVCANNPLYAASVTSGDEQQGSEMPGASAVRAFPNAAATGSLASLAGEEEERAPLIVTHPRLHTNFEGWLIEAAHGHYGVELSTVERGVFEGYLQGIHRTFYDNLKRALEEDDRFIESAYLRKSPKEGLRGSIISESFDAVCKIVGIGFGAYLMNQLPADTAGKFENTMWITAVAAIGTVGKSVWKLGGDIKEMCCVRRGLTPTEDERSIEAEKMALYIALRYLQKDTLPAVNDTVNMFVNWLIDKYPRGSTQSLAYVLYRNPEIFQ